MFIYKAYYKILSIVRIFIYKMMFGKKISIGSNTRFRRGFFVLIEGEGNIKIGENAFFNNNCSLMSRGSIQIGNDCLFGENVTLVDANHRFRSLKKKICEQGFKIGKIVIGDNCWIANNVVILKNVTIGDNVVIGANTLISESIPTNSIVTSGNHIVVRPRNEEQIASIDIETPGEQE